MARGDIPDELTRDLGADESQEPSERRRRVARELGRPGDSLPELVVLMRSIEARRGRVRLHVVVGPATLLPPMLGGAPLPELDSSPSSATALPGCSAATTSREPASPRPST